MRCDMLVLSFWFASVRIFIFSLLSVGQREVLVKICAEDPEARDCSIAMVEIFMVSYLCRNGSTREEMFYERTTINHRLLGCTRRSALLRSCWSGPSFAFTARWHCR